MKNVNHKFIRGLIGKIGFVGAKKRFNIDRAKKIAFIAEYILKNTDEFPADFKLTVKEMLLQIQELVFYLEEDYRNHNKTKETKMKKTTASKTKKQSQKQLQKNQQQSQRKNQLNHL